MKFKFLPIPFIIGMLFGFFLVKLYWYMEGVKYEKFYAPRVVETIKATVNAEALKPKILKSW